MVRKFCGWPGQNALWRLVQQSLLNIHPYNGQELARMQSLMTQYQDTPMDLGDASLVVAAEELGESKVFTLDQDFYVYRLSGGQGFEVVP